VLEAAREYAALARANGMTPATLALALAWCYSRWFVASTIIGATNLTQLQENIDADGVTLLDELVDAVNSIHARFTSPGQ
jgi:aryl-alcohol dehydrogenase-like predicted oxidoreductase